MIIESKLNEGKLTVTPIGRIDSNSGASLNSYLLDKINDEVKIISFDFSKVDFISSMGLRILISVYKNKNEKKMEILYANSSVKEILKLSGFLKIFNVK